MREIGGYFGLEQLVNNEYHEGLLRLNTATNAFLYVLKAKGTRKVYIPYYLCDSVSNMLKRNGYEFEYYKITAEFLPAFHKEMQEDECCYIVNYFGQLTNEQIFLLKRKFTRIVIDNTHAFFQRPVGRVDTIYSCRKFFGVPDGAYLSTNSRMAEKLEIDISKKRMTHILGRFEETAAAHHKHFQEADTLLHLEPIKYMSRLTSNILGAIDYEKVQKSRNRNYAFLQKELKKLNRLDLSLSNGPFSYPLLIENGDEIRERLAVKKIYVPTLWKNVLGTVEAGSIEYRYALNILPLPCDQRYEIEDMEYIVKCLKAEI